MANDQCSGAGCASSVQQNQQTPVVLMGYANPVEPPRLQKLCQGGGCCGVDGLLTVDTPPEEADDMVACLKQYNVAQIFLLAPTTRNPHCQGWRKWLRVMFIMCHCAA